ncbi:MAG: hypothetical protein ACYC7E_22500 [Armatimonadota bacterium]
MVLHSNDNDVPRIPPSATFPWLVILFLLSAMVAIYLFMLRPPAELQGPPLPKNTYLQFMKPPKVDPPPGTPTPTNTAAQPVPAGTTPPAVAPAQPAPAAPTPAGHN